MNVGTRCLVLYDPTSPSWAGEIVEVVGPPEFGTFKSASTGERWTTTMVLVRLGDTEGYCPPQWLLPLPPDTPILGQQKVLEAS